MEFFEIETNYRTFQIEAAGIGDAIDRALNFLLMKEQGEFLRRIERTEIRVITIQVAA